MVQPMTSDREHEVVVTTKLWLRHMQARVAMRVVSLGLASAVYLFPQSIFSISASISLSSSAVWLAGDKFVSSFERETKRTPLGADALCKCATVYIKWRKVNLFA